MTSTGRQLLMLVSAMMMTMASGLTCYSCSSTGDAGPACRDPLNTTADGVGRCTSQTHCVAIKMTGGSLGEYRMVWYGMVNVDLYGAIIAKVSNALNTLVSGEKPGFRALSKRLIVLLCAEVVRQGVPDHGAVHSECSASNSG